VSAATYDLFGEALPDGIDQAQRAVCHFVQAVCHFVQWIMSATSRANCCQMASIRSTGGDELL